MNFRGWIKLIYDKITLIYSVKNEFNPTSEVQNIGNGAFQNAPFANAPFANGSFPNGGYSCLWAMLLSWGKTAFLTKERVKQFFWGVSAKPNCFHVTGYIFLVRN